MQTYHNHRLHTREIWDGTSYVHMLQPHQHQCQQQAQAPRQPQQSLHMVTILCSDIQQHKNKNKSE